MISVAEHEPIHERQGGVWEYISPSRLNLFLKCPLAYKLKYIDGIKSPASPALIVGKAVHGALEALYRHRMLGITLTADELGRRVLSYWEEAAGEDIVPFKSAEQEMALQVQAVSLVRAYVEQMPANESRPLAVEATMEMPLVDPVTGENLGIPLLGVVDLILDGSNGPLIADFKSTSKAMPPFEITHELQLSSYAWLFRQMTGDEEAGLEIRSLIKTKRPKVQFHSYPARTERHFRRLFSVIREYLDALDRGSFNFRPGWGCAMCDFREAGCRGWCGS